MPVRKRTNDEWRNMIARQRASGQTQEAWCKANGVNLYTLRDRGSRLKKIDRELAQTAEQAEDASAGWMEVRPERLAPAKNLPRSENSTGISITNGAWTVTAEAGFDTELLTAVLRAVSRVCC